MFVKFWSLLVLGRRRQSGINFTVEIRPSVNRTTDTDNYYFHNVYVTNPVQSLKTSQAFHYLLGFESKAA